MSSKGDVFVLALADPGHSRAVTKPLEHERTSLADVHTMKEGK